MSKQTGLHAFALILATSLALGCGDFQDDVRPTPTRAPTSTPDPNAPPTPTPSCGGSGGVPGCRNFTWTQNQGNSTSPTGFFASVDLVGNVGNAGLTGGFKLGSFFLQAGPGDDQGVSEVRLIGPPESDTEPNIIFFVKLLVDAQCLRIYPETSEGELYCDGRSGQGVDTRLTAPSGTFRRDQPRDQTWETDLGDSAPPGSMVLRVEYQLARASEGDNANQDACLTFPECEPCTNFPNCPSEQVKNCYQPRETAVFTTGTTTVMKGDIKLQVPGDPLPPPGVTGEPFDCSNFQMGDGPGRLVLGQVDYDDELVGDTAAALRLSDK